MRCRVVNSSGTVISESTYIILTEGASITQIGLKEGYLNLSTVYFQFSGNTVYPAQAIVSYYG